jgi:uncharacterized membrane protein
MIAQELISPNWHVILIHYPLGVFMLGMLLELLLLVFRHHGPVRSAARWMIVLGALAGLPAAYSGMYALADVARPTAPTAVSDAPWHAVADAKLTAEQWELVESHVWTSGGITVIAAILVTLAVACSNRWRERLYPVFLGLLLGCAGTMAVGAWYGGEMVYRQGISVQMPDVKIENATPTTSPTRSYINPVQTHVMLAGLAAAMGMMAIGLSLRAAATAPHWEDPELGRAGVTPLPNRQRGGAEDMAVLRSFAPRVEVTGEVERIPTSRFWLLTFLVTVATSLAGWWVLADGHQTYRPQDLWKLVTAEGYIRRLAHVITAAAIIVLPLFLSLLARVARRSRTMIASFSVLLVLALAAQVWLGVLLLFDQPKLPSGERTWYRFVGAMPASP